MNRFEEAPEEAVSEVQRIVIERFPDLINAKIKVLYDSKKRMQDGKIVLARMLRANDLLRCLTTSEAMSDEGFDYFMFLDKMAYENVSGEDRIRMIRHELQHCDVDIESAKNPYGLQGHDIEDFIDEVQANASDPQWRERVALSALSMYDEEAERQKEARKGDR